MDQYINIMNLIFIVSMIIYYSQILYSFVKLYQTNINDKEMNDENLFSHIMWSFPFNQKIYDNYTPYLFIILLLCLLYTLHSIINAFLWPLSLIYHIYKLIVYIMKRHRDIIRNKKRLRKKWSNND